MAPSVSNSSQLLHLCFGVVHVCRSVIFLYFCNDEHPCTRPRKTYHRLSVGKDPSPRRSKTHGRNFRGRNDGTCGAQRMREKHAAPHFGGFPPSHQRLGTLARSRTNRDAAARVIAPAEHRPYRPPRYGVSHGARDCGNGAYALH